MIAVDTNILIYAHREESEFHAAALRFLVGLGEGRVPWGLPVFCIPEFIRATTNKALLDRASGAGVAHKFIEHLLTSPSLRVLNPGDSFPRLFGEICLEESLSGNEVFDAAIAAVCLEHGVRELVTEDRGFKRFKGLRIRRL